MPSDIGSVAFKVTPIPECRTEGFELLQRPVWILDTVRMRKHYANAAARALWQVAPGEEAEFFARDFTPHSAAIRARLGLTIDRLRAGEVFTERWSFYPKGQPFMVDCLMSPVRLPNGNVGMLVEATIPEIEAAERRGVEALRHTAVMVSLYDDEGRLLFRNPAAARCFPGAEHRFLAGFSDSAEGRALWRRAFDHEPARTDAFLGKTASGDFRMRTAAGERWHGIDIRTTTDPVSGSISVLVNERDITDRIEAHARSDYLATHDAMTGLINRSRFMELLEAAMQEPGSTGALITLDLDNFKEINDTHGHGAGDVVLREIGARLRANARGRDLCARVGGDEFAILLPGMSDPELLLCRAAEIDLRLSKIIVDPLSDGAFTLAASFGIACWPQDGSSPDALQRNADLALYAAKSETGRRIRRFDMALRRTADQRHQCIQDLGLALANDAFEVHFQPIVELSTARLVGFEALLRWQHPVHGMQLPDMFVPAAESVGLMAPIGGVMLGKTCAQIRAWLDQGLDPGRVAVNLSANQFRDPRLAEQLIEMVRAAGLTPAQIEFEVPETVTLGRRGEMVLATLSSLRESGFGIALDDFGTGHASLTHLRRLPVGKIKIDRSFIADMERSADDRAIVHAVVALGRELGMKVLAEGIENEGQRALLVSIGCDLGQGFHHGRPMDGETATHWLRRLAEPRPGGH
ncbi:diguanylate cyclase (GGDEF)-like protein [Angulomicrobium tetraedrale]|uniref:Diguanylate cyclase (GGDEF)-like protein n=1 Tax=Ancylobacter tetraedralis TaxID=217068 RepID=A0A839ZBH2_9HYPH|nr:EAL domain-containing protein [Ancylobacter tetraedralis]MBB3772113.1 diguanylate cyclase (GGDEF)-like protein [Ancylobacter tetraedralis]